MSKLLRIRRAINDMKRNSQLQSVRETENDLPFSTYTERRPSIEQESGFHILPIAISRENTPTSGEEESSSEQFADSSLYIKTDAKHFIREKKTKNYPAFRVMKRNRDLFNETVRNVSELMANPVQTFVRINKTVERQNRHMSSAHRQLVQVVAGPKTIKFSMQGRMRAKRQRNSPRKQRCSPKKLKKGWTSRVRRTLSPKKNASPLMKFQLSAWQTTEDMQFQLN